MPDKLLLPFVHGLITDCRLCCSKWILHCRTNMLQCSTLFGMFTMRFHSMLLSIVFHDCDNHAADMHVLDAEGSASNGGC